MRYRRLVEATKLDIGCKTSIKDGFTGIDYQELGQQILWDIREGLPFPDNTITDIYCNHFLEHLDNKDIEGFFLELYRICKDGASIEIGVPHSESLGAYTHNHLSFWNELRFKGLVAGYDGQERFVIESMVRKTNNYYEELRVYLKVNKQGAGK